jgi:hypothetical protein
MRDTLKERTPSLDAPIRDLQRRQSLKKTNAVTEKTSPILQKSSGEKADERRLEVRLEFRLEVRLVSKKRDKRRLGRPEGYIEKVLINCKP